MSSVGVFVALALALVLCSAEAIRVVFFQLGRWSVKPRRWRYLIVRRLRFEATWWTQQVRDLPEIVRLGAKLLRLRAEVFIAGGTPQ